MILQKHLKIFRSKGNYGTYRYFKERKLDVTDKLIGLYNRLEIDKRLEEDFKFVLTISLLVRLRLLLYSRV